jgi:DNA-binding CsgD family transcriptional regulator
LIDTFFTNTQLPLVGRTRELEIIFNHFEACRNALLRVVLVSGEPGIGKTRLLNEVAWQLNKAGAVVLRGGASQAEGMPPYLPFLEALGKYIQQVDLEVLQGQVDRLGTTLITILPELADRLKTLPQTYPLPPEQARFRLFKAVGDFLQNIARVAPIVLMLDDLQWVDTASLDLLCHIARHQPDAAILVVGNYREAELKDNQALQQAIFQLNRLRVLTTVSLKALAESEITRLASQFLNQGLTGEFGHRLYTQSEGNPFFAEELLRHWLTEGWLVQSDVKCEFIDLKEDQSALPGSIASLVDQNLSRLDVKVAAVLQVAAIIGRSFEISFLANVVGEEPEVVEERLTEAEKTGLIRSTGQNWYLFSHDKIREGIYSQVSAFRRKRLHGFIGRELQLQNDQASAKTCENLAYHFVRSGDRQRGANYAQLAGEKALAASALAAALTHYRAALELLEPTDERLDELLLELGMVERLNNKNHEAIVTFQKALAHFKQTGDKSGEGLAYYELGQTYWRLEELKSAQQSLQQALAILESLPQPGDLLVSVLVELGSMVAVSLNQQAEGLEFGYRALVLARQLRNARIEAGACRIVGNLLARTNKIREALPLLETGLELAQSENDLIEAAECCACLSLVYFWTGHFKQFKEVMKLRVDLAERCQDPFQLRHVYAWQAVGDILQGRLDQAKLLLDKTMIVIEKLESPEPKAFLMQAFAYIKFYQKEYGPALLEMEQSMAIFREEVPESLVWYLGILAYFHHRYVHPCEAAKYMEEVEKLLEGQPHDSLVIADALSKLVPIAIDTNDRTRVVKFHKALLPFTGLFVDNLIDRLLAEMEIYLGDLTAAHGHLDTAEAVAESQEIFLELALCKGTRSKMARSQGNPDKARLYLEQAIVLCEKYGYASEVERWQAALAVLNKSRDPARQVYPAGLSEREASVLRLVVAGMSNRQIAQELSLSEKTVANHLTGIFNKTDCDNRAAATAFALRHGIAL